MAKLGRGAVFMLMVWLCVGSREPAFGQDNPPAASATAQSDAETGKAADQGLVIEPEELPQTYPHGDYHVQFQARGNYVPVLQWKVQSGSLPPGIKLEENGLLHGSAEKAGEFQFAVSVRDGGQPRQAVQRGYVIKVVDAITVAWKTPPRVAGSRIGGSVEVSNAAADDIDLTFDVKAVAENGRATEIGYQHFPLKRGTIGMVLPFGETLPHGAYMVNVTVVGEVARRNAIYREMLQSPAPLQVTVGP
ncbi:MAG: hypothetical protein WBW36_13530 [Candidatus Sulfotelmatobacter sp.]